MPRSVQPITGDGLAFLARGDTGVAALRQGDGSEAWRVNPGGSIDSTPVYDNGSRRLFVCASNGRVYGLDPQSGAVAVMTDAGAAIAGPPALIDDTLIISSGSSVVALRTDDLSERWRYDAGSAVHTPPSISAVHGVVVVGIEDLTVHGIELDDGAQRFATKPTPLPPGTDAHNEYHWGWPVIAEGPRSCARPHR